jgi:hypothetical protein
MPMRNAPRDSAFRLQWVFWVGTVALGTACGGDERAPTVGAAGTSSTITPAPDAGTGGSDTSTPEGVTPPSSDELPPAPSGLDPAGGISGCTLGETRECSIDLICTGVETCGENGTFGACDCGAPSLDGSGGIVGASCASDADCAGGGTCLTGDGNGYLGAGGPAGGYCTFSCSREADDCATHDAQSFCAPIGPEEAGYCIRTCLSQDPEPGEAKCLNRTDVVCVSVAADGYEPFNGQRQAGYCRPLCGSDADCPAGRVCHAQGHICTDGQIPGASIGAACSLDSDCSGYACEDRNAEGIGVCTATCVLGSLSGCGYGHDVAARGAACLTPLVAANRFSEGVGDLGLCREVCNVNEDCQQAGWVCTPLNPEAAEFFGVTGACIPG